MIKAKIVAAGETMILELEPETDSDRRSLDALVCMTIPLARDLENGRLAKIFYNTEESNRQKRVFIVS